MNVSNAYKVWQGCIRTYVQQAIFRTWIVRYNTVGWGYLSLHIAHKSPEVNHCVPVMPHGIIKLGQHWLTHWGQVTHIYVSKLACIGLDNGLSPGRRQAIIWTNAGILSIGPLGTNFSDSLIEILIFPFKKMHLKMSTAILSRPQCVDIMACCLEKWSHYFTQHWQITS